MAEINYNLKEMPGVVAEYPVTAFFMTNQGIFHNK